MVIHCCQSANWCHYVDLILFFFLNENNAGTHSSISNCNFHSRLGDWCPRTDNEWRYKCGSNLNTHDETFEHKIRWLATRYVGVKIKRMFYLMRIVWKVKLQHKCADKDIFVKYFSQTTPQDTYWWCCFPNCYKLEELITYVLKHTLSFPFKLQFFFVMKLRFA